MRVPSRRQLRRNLDEASRLGRALALAHSRRTHPRVDGAIAVEGSGAAIEITRDTFGVPHIRASSDADAIYGLGFVHGQDRLFQMDALRRLALGRLAEVGGGSLVTSDRFMRRLGLADRAGRDYARLEADQRALLVAYASGVNAAIDSTAVLPPEFALTGIPPEPWHPEHTLALARFVLFTFALNWDSELLRERLLAALGPARAFELDAAYPAEALTATGLGVPAAERLLVALEAAFEAGLPVGGASNAWAVGPARTATGAPLLAADPHLQAGLPSLFHVAHLAGATFDAVGAGIPGIPGVVLGHNGCIAWGITAGMADVADCYIERVDPGDPARYLTPEGWVTGRTRIERIAVRDAEAVEERVLETRHGPMLGPALPGESRAIALRCTVLEDVDLTSPFLAMLRATSPADFEEACARWPGAAFNFVWAHRAGAIGYRMAGSVPARAPGAGLLPQDGATSPGPPALLPAEALPRLVDPSEGFVVSANNAPGGEAELGVEWCDRYRAERISELLRTTADDGAAHTVASLQAIQVDLRSVPLLALRDFLLDAAAFEGVPRSLVEAWDGQVGAGSAAAAILETVYGELARTLVTRLAGDHADIVLGRGLEAVVGGSSFHYRLQGRLIEVLATARAPWFDGSADRDRVLRAAAARALLGLGAELGADPARWRWGDLHRLHLEHPLARVPGLGRAFSRGPFPSGGDINTVWQGGYSVYRGPGSRGFSPAYRQVIDLVELDRSTFALPGGNSGIPGHPRYDDGVAEFLAGRQRPLLYTAAAVARHAEHRLLLHPAGHQAAA